MMPHRYRHSDWHIPHTHTHTHTSENIWNIHHRLKQRNFKPSLRALIWDLTLECCTCDGREHSVQITALISVLVPSDHIQGSEVKPTYTQFTHLLLSVLPLSWLTQTESNKPCCVLANSNKRHKKQKNAPRCLELGGFIFTLDPSWLNPVAVLDQFERGGGQVGTGFFLLEGRFNAGKKTNPSIKHGMNGTFTISTLVTG